MRFFNPIITLHRRSALAYARVPVGPACARIFIEHAIFRAQYQDRPPGNRGFLPRAIRRHYKQRYLISMALPSLWDPHEAAIYSWLISTEK
jgi:hypothetical protein